MSAPQIQMSDLHNKVKHVSYTVLPDGRTTICQLTVENGYSIIGKSACVCIENYNQGLGEKYAFEDAMNQLWPLEGYLLAENLFRNTLALSDAL